MTTPKNLIVVGNRVSGPARASCLGSVPAAVVKGAKCDVLIVQGTQDRIRGQSR